MVFEAEELVKQAIERHGDNIGVACSFGKDSMVVLHMALKYNPNIKVFFANTGVEFPETILFKNKIVKEWNLNYFESKPIKTFWKCAKEYGLPSPRGRGKNRQPKCCMYSKEKPLENLQKKEKINAIFTGLMAEESRQRKLTMMRYDHGKAPRMKHEGYFFCGQRWHSLHDNMWKYHPLAYWTEKEIWKYIKENNIPVNEVYTKWNGLYKRCGCLPCTAYLDWEKKLPKSHPKLYLMLKKIQKPKQQTLRSEEE